MVNLLARNQIAVYPIDARGLVGDPWFDASKAGAANVTSSIKGLSNGVQRTSTSAAIQKWTMTDIADPTGGQAFMNTNDLKGAVSQAIDAGSNYYTLTYAPTSHK
jgi:VWFA-related protein